MPQGNARRATNREKGVTRPFLFCLFLLAGAASPAAAQDATAGAGLYKQRCQMCHSLTPGQKSPMGPNLAGVIGRKAGSMDFSYSDGMKRSGIVWDAAKLDPYLAGPTKVIPGGKMAISVSDAKQRADIIAFLQKQGK